ncbi:MAG: thioredoxin family protein [Peptococcaceae bacterium]
MEIKVLGPGCMNCKKLYQEVESALADLNVTANVKKVEDMAEIIKMGVISTPGLVINGKVKVKGRVPTKEQIKKYLQEEMG